MTVSFVKHDSSDDSYSDATGDLTIGGGGGPPTGSAGGVLDGSYPNPGLAAGVAGNGLAETSDVLSVNVDGSTIEISSDSLRVKASGITANEIAADAVGSSEIASGAVGTAELASAVLLGSVELVYRYTVTGSDKASIDTGVDTPDAGTNDWTNGDLLEIWIYARTDEAVAESAVNMNVNNDSNSIYDRMLLTGLNATASAANSLGQTTWARSVAGSSAGSGSFGVLKLVFPNYAGTVGNKMGEITNAKADATAGNNRAEQGALQWRSTAAITRFKVAATGSQKLKVGSQLLIYKRRSA